MNSADLRPNVILVLPVLKPAGAERVVAELAHRLPAYGFATSVICLEDENEAIGRELIQAGVPVAGLRLSRFRTLACAFALAERLPADRPLIINSHLFHANLAARLAVRCLSPRDRAGVHVLSTVQVVERRFRPWQFRLDRLTAGLADAEICVSPAVARYQQQRTGLPPGFFRVIENGTDLTPFQAIHRDSRTEDPRVVSVGRLNLQKDYPTLLRAWQIVEKQHDSARLSIAGAGPQERHLRNLAAALKLERFELLGFVVDIPPLLSKADLYVQSSRWEGLPLSVIEAMASQLPIIVTDGDGLPDTITHGRTGIVVPRQNPPALAKAIVDLLNDPHQGQTLASSAREEAQQRFSAERMVRQYADLYRTILQRT
jgi:glycosyltransferase involved in cell wall biosynthesis